MAELDSKRTHLEEGLEWQWQKLALFRRSSNWRETRCGQVPWIRVHEHLDDMDTLWFAKHGGREAWFGPKYNNSWKSTAIKNRVVNVRAPWQADRRVSTLANEFEGPWQQGPSGDEWWMNGRNHLPSEWTELEAAADRDIKWLTEEAERFRKVFFPTAKEERTRSYKQLKLKKPTAAAADPRPKKASSQRHTFGGGKWSQK